VKKNYLAILVSLMLVLPLAAQAFPPKKGDKACIECHKLSKKDAEAIVKKVVPTATVTEVRQSPIKGAWQIEFDAGEGKRGTFGLDFSKKYFVQYALVEQVAKQQQQPPKKVDVSKIHLGDAITVGAKDAAKRVIVFSDPDCPFCKQLHKTIRQIIAKRPDVAFVELLYPLPMHPNAPKKVQAILCSKSLPLLDQYFEADDKTVAAEPPANCTTEAMERNKALAQSLGLNGTPTMVRDDGAVLAGALPEDKLLEWIDKKQ